MSYHVHIDCVELCKSNIMLCIFNQFLQFTIFTWNNATSHCWWNLNELFRCYAPNIIAWIYIKLYGKRNFCCCSMKHTDKMKFFDLRNQSTERVIEMRAGLRILPETAIPVCGFVNHCLLSSTWYTRQTEYRSQFFYPTVNVSHFRIVYPIPCSTGHSQYKRMNNMV